MRYAGILLSIIIEYQQASGEYYFNDKEPLHYNIRVKQVKGAEFKYNNYFRVGSNGDMIWENRHGIGIEFSQSVQICFFDFSGLLLALVSSLALLAVADKLTELTMLYVL